MLKTENISYTIDKAILLHETSIAFEPGKFHIIIGANGAGKSTLLKLLAGSEKPSAGKVLLNDRDIRHYNAKELATKRAVLSQHYNIAFPVSVNDVVMMGRYPYFGNIASAFDREVCKRSM